MSEKTCAAGRRNGKLSHGATTEEGKARAGAAHFRHGFCPQAENAALRSFGEDPAEREELLAGLDEEFAPSTVLQPGLKGEPSEICTEMSGICIDLLFELREPHAEEKDEGAEAEKARRKLEIF